MKLKSIWIYIYIFPEKKKIVSLNSIYIITKHRELKKNKKNQSMISAYTTQQVLLRNVLIHCNE